LSDTVTPIDTATDTAGSPISVGSQPEGVTVAPNGQTVYVANYGDGTVTPIDTATGTAGNPISVGSGPDGIAITPDQGPVASFDATPAPAGQATAFDASASTAPGAPISTYKWNFGDGHSATTTVPQTDHVYTAAGSYDVTLTLTDADGTSTKEVFTGQTLSRNGTAGAKTTQSVSILSA
jgi:YVTN family beta-propeller protein